MKGRKGKRKGDPICVNCGSKGHIVNQCKTPFGHLKERFFYRCGKPRHVAWACPEKQKVANSVEEGEERDATRCEHDLDVHENGRMCAKMLCVRAAVFQFQLKKKPGRGDWSRKWCVCVCVFALPCFSSI